jgi:phytoene/squalene synthetase
MNQSDLSSQQLAIAITKAASRQTFYTIRLLADRGFAADAFRAYAYFRWVDDILDSEKGSPVEKAEFLSRQTDLLARCYQGETPVELCPEEQILADLVSHHPEPESGLRAYLDNMMAVMAFDVRRRGTYISQSELDQYSHHLAVAVTEALYFFIGHDDPSPRHEARYLAVTAAHITHMLRDTMEDVSCGYYNVPSEVLSTCGITPWDVSNPAYREWVRQRVQLARVYFKAGRACTAQVKNWRCRLAGCAYTARFEWMLRRIELDAFRLRKAYPERKSLFAGLAMGWATLISVFALPWINLIMHAAGRNQ